MLIMGVSGKIGNALDQGATHQKGWSSAEASQASVHIALGQ